VRVYFIEVVLYNKNNKNIYKSEIKEKREIKIMKKK
jgi:hypothetical protein